MMQSKITKNGEEKVLLPHHEQQELCTTRLPYRQGRKLTAIKAYTINNESNNLLIFGVPSLNLRQEAKALFVRFGKLLQFYVTTDHPAEVFTETYHAKFENIHSARIAKKMLDTKNFYGGLLHVCYAPEFESPDEMRQKILKRKQDVLFRLRNLEKDATVENNKVVETKVGAEVEETQNKIFYVNNKRTMNMGEVNTIIVSNKKKKNGKVKKFNPTPIINEIVNNDDINDSTTKTNDLDNKCNISVNNKDFCEQNSHISNVNEKWNDEIEVVDFTSVDKEVVSNINDALNYNKFGNEVIRKVPYKPLNRIVFNINNKKL